MGAIALATLCAAALLAAGCGPAETAPAAESAPLTAAPRQDPEEQRFTAARQAMVQDVEAGGVSDLQVLEAMRNVPRHRFVRPGNRDEAYLDRPLPIGSGQTISQPFIVGLMTQALGLEPGARVLEVGTGSGYQAAVLAELGASVYSVEIVPALAEWGAQNLRGAGYGGVQRRLADGYFGWEEFAPFDAIIVTAAPDHVPPPLVGQLRDGGRMVVPVGPPGFVQTLWLIEKDGDDVRSTNLGRVRFVRFTGAGLSESN